MEAQNTESTLLLDELSQLLGRMAEHQDLLAQCLHQEISTDGALDSAGVIGLQGQKARLARLIQAQEKERMALTGRLARAWMAEPQELTLKVIAHQAVARFGAPEATGQALLGLHQRLLSGVEEIAALARASARNASARNKAVGALLDSVKDTLKTHATYSPRGRVNNSGPVIKHVSA